MDFSSTPVAELLEYQLALSNAVEAIALYERRNITDLSSTKDTLARLNGKIQDALKDAQFEIDKLKES